MDPRFKISHNMPAKKPRKQPSEWILQEIQKAEEWKTKIAAAVASPMSGMLGSFKRQFNEHNEHMKRMLEPRTEELYFSAPRPPLTREDLNAAIDAIKPPKSRRKQQTVIILNTATRLLYLQDNPEKTFSLASAKIRFHLIRLLKESPQSTYDLANKAESTEKSVRVAFSVLNGKIQSVFGLKEKLILGEAKAGYRINPLYLLKKI